MLAFKIGDTPLDLDAKMKVSFTMLNPIFDKEGLQRVFSYSVKFPVTPQNNSVFQHNYRMDAKGRRQYDMTCYLQHLPFEKGVFILQRTNDQFYAGVFSNETISVAKIYKAKRLRDLEMIEKTPIAEPVTNTFVAETFPGSTQTCQININGRTFIDHITASPGIVGQINEVFPGVCQLISLVDGGPDNRTLTISITWADANEPLWIDYSKDLGRYIAFVAQSPIVQTSDVVSAAWTAKLDEIKTTPTTHCFPCVRNDNFYDGKNPLYVGYVNYVNSVAGNYLTFGTYGTTPQWQSTLVPYVFVKELLRVVAELTGHTPSGDFYNYQLMNELLVHSNISIEEVYFQKMGPDGSGTDNAFFHTAKSKYNLADVLPDIYAFDLLQYLRSTFFLFFNVENGQLYFNTIKSQLVATIEDWTQKITPDYDKKISEKASLEIKYKYDREEDPEHLYNDTQLNHLTIPGNENISPESWDIDFFSLFTNVQKNEESLDPYERDWVIPQITEQGNSTPFALKNDTQPRLLLYKGWKRDSLDYQYPLATSQDVDFEGNDLGEHTLNIDGDKGTYNQFGKEFLRLINKGDTIEMGARLTIADILNIRRWKAVRKYITHPKGTFVGIIRSVRFTATMESIETASVEFVRQS